MSRLNRLLCMLLVALAGAAGPGNNGLPVGARVPPFEAADQAGRRQTFDSIKGSKGAFLLFHRSADW